MKTCTTCKILKPLSEYSKSKANKDGKCNRCKDCDRAYYNKNKEKCNEYQKQYRETQNPNYQKLYYKSIEKILNRQFASSIARAKKKNLPRTITREWFNKKVLNGTCELTGIEFDYTTKVLGARCKPYLPSIDRIDNSKGYTEDNCRVVLWCLNVAFSDYGLEFLMPVFKKLTNTSTT